MKNIRIIPRLDIKGPNVIKGIHCEGLRVVGNPKELAAKYYKEGADELLYIDIVASLYERNFDFEQFKNAVSDVYIPITAGGGIRSHQDIEKALRSGADKVAINTFAINNQEFITSSAKKFGSQCIVLQIDAKIVRDMTWEAYTDGGREKTGINAVKWAKRAVELGAGEILITSIDQEGMQTGYDLDLLNKISNAVNVPIIACGGAGDDLSVSDAITKGLTDAIGAASIFHYNTSEIPKLKQYLAKENITTRII